MPTFQHEVKVTFFGRDVLTAAGASFQPGSRGIIDLPLSRMRFRGTSGLIMDTTYAAGACYASTLAPHLRDAEPSEAVTVMMHGEHSGTWNGTSGNFVFTSLYLKIPVGTSRADIYLGFVKSITIVLPDGEFSITRDSPLELAPIQTFLAKLREVVPNLGRLAMASIQTGTQAEVVPKLRFGFELETQRSEGANARGGSDREYFVDTDKMRRKANQIYKSYLGEPTMWWEFLPNMYNNWEHSGQRYDLREFDQWSAFVREAGIAVPGDLVRLGLVNNDQRRSMETALRDRANGMVEAADYATPKDINWFRGRFNKKLTPLKIEVGTDGSVAGFEFRTQGGLTSEEWDAAAEHLLTEYKQEVDTGCSFHLHVSVVGAPSHYNERFQAALTEYLLTNMERVPAKVRERWASPAVQQYALAQLRHTKYSFVHCHEFGTWEFRCFGNIDKADDAKVCKQLAIEAMMFAARACATDSTERLVYGTVNNAAWQNEMQALCKGSRALNVAERLTLDQIRELNLTPRPSVVDEDDEDEDADYEDERDYDRYEPEEYYPEDEDLEDAQ